MLQLLVFPAMGEPAGDFVIAGEPVRKVACIEVADDFHERRGGDKVEELLLAGHAAAIDFLPRDIVEGPLGCPVHCCSYMATVMRAFNRPATIRPAEPTLQL